MGVASDNVPRIAEAAGVSLVTAGHIHRLIRGEHTPLSPKGAGPASSKALHWTTSHYTNFILALTAQLPSDALDLVSSLRNLVLTSFFKTVQSTGNQDSIVRTSTGTQANRLMQYTLGEKLDDLLNDKSKLSTSERKSFFAGMAVGKWELLVVLEHPPIAAIKFESPDGTTYSEWYGSDKNEMSQPTPHGMRRQVAISASVFEVAAELLADTPSASRSLSSSGSDEPDQKTKTPAPRHREPAPTRDRPVHKAPTGTDAPEVKVPYTHTQALDCLPADHSTPSASEESCYDGPQALDAAAA